MGPSRCSNIFLSGNSAWCNVPCSPLSGTGENIATAVIDYLESVGVSTADTEILGEDGTTVNTESCVHVTPGGVATEEDDRAPRRPHNWSSELLWPYWKATEERPTTPHSPKPPLHASTPS